MTSMPDLFGVLQRNYNHIRQASYNAILKNHRLFNDGFIIMLASDVVIVLAADRLELGSSFALINPHETTGNH